MLSKYLKAKEFYRKGLYKEATDLIEQAKDEVPTSLPSEIKLNRDYDCANLAGYSTKGDTIFFDKDLPESFTDKSGKKWATDRFLLVHEVTEKALSDHLGLSYDTAHDLATAAEKRAVENAGCSWQEYCDFMDKYVELNAKKKIENPPPDYEDPETKKSYTSKSYRRLYNQRYEIVAEDKKFSEKHNKQ